MDENYKEVIFRGGTEEFVAALADETKRQIGFALWQA